jgi:hypothetical protein
MSDQDISDNKKRRGRPATGTGELIGLRLQPRLLSALDTWIERRPEPKPGRPEAVRRLLLSALGLQPEKD